MVKPCRAQGINEWREKTILTHPRWRRSYDACAGIILYKGMKGVLLILSIKTISKNALVPIYMDEGSSTTHMQPKDHHPRPTHASALLEYYVVSISCE